MAHLGRVTETMTTRTVGLTREQVAAWHDATWTDTTTPRTDRPVRFAFGGFANIHTGAYRPSITYRA